MDDDTCSVAKHFIELLNPKNFIQLHQSYKKVIN